MQKRLAAYARFVKVEHTLFSLPLLFAGAFLAAGRLPSWPLWGWIIAAGFGARTAAFAINRIADRHVDRLNPRTATRELPRGTMQVWEGWVIGAFGTAVYLLSAWAISPVCLYASPIPLIVFALYPFMKRFTWTAHFGVGLADAMAPLGGYVAVTRSLHPFWPGFLLALFTFFWVSGFDIIYATLDEEFDRQQGLHSAPARFGRRGALQLSALLHVIAFGVLVLLYRSALRTPLAFAGLLGIGALLYLEHANADNVDLAFFKINAALGFGILGLVAVGAGL
jgi:4-hydroxybenzoate polyprenyltransferase